MKKEHNEDCSCMICCPIYPDKLYIKITEHLGDLALCEAYYSNNEETIIYERKK